MDERRTKEGGHNFVTIQLSVSGTALFCAIPKLVRTLRDIVCPRLLVYRARSLEMPQAIYTVCDIYGIISGGVAVV